MFKPEPGRHYGMPVTFGPSKTPAVTKMDYKKSVTVRFRTEAAAIERLLPHYFALNGPPIVSVGHTTNRGVDYMAGRGYNLVRVAVPAIFKGQEDTVSGNYPLVIWESNPNPVIMGRELSGYTKIPGVIPDLTETVDGCSFELREYDSRLLHGEVTELQPVAGPALEALQKGGRNSITLGWKYIQDITGELDADYPTKIVNDITTDRAWTGKGEVTFYSPSWDDAPFASHIIDALRDLPVLGWESASVSEGSSYFPRDQMKRLR